MTILKPLKYEYCLSFFICPKYILEFADPTHTTYWPAKVAKKVADSLI